MTAPRGIPVISLWQPWASAMALGYKAVETRHFGTHVRGPVAIHAAQRRSHSAEYDALAVASCAVRDLVGFSADRLIEGRDAVGALAELSDNRKTLPRGAVVAIGLLVTCVPTAEIRDELGLLERALGNYDDRRFGWVFNSLRGLPQPVPLKGRQGFFRWTPPDELLPLIPTMPTNGGNDAQQEALGL